MNEQERRRTVFQRLHDSEINFHVSCFRNGGFEVKLGDETFQGNGRRHQDIGRGVGLSVCQTRMSRIY